MTFDQEKIKHLRTIGHQLKPIVTISEQGVSEGVMNELDRALDDHELIKVKITVNDRLVRQQWLEELCQQSGAVLIHKIGKVALICRVAKKTNKKLSNLHRVH